MINEDLKIKVTPGKGRGVFAKREFVKGEVIEECPLLLLTPDERHRMENTLMDFYIYPWRSLQDAAVVLGWGSIYNHSFEPNAIWVRDYKRKLMVYKAYKDIKKGEEILVNYNGDPDDRESVEWMKNTPRRKMY